MKKVLLVLSIAVFYLGIGKPGYSSDQGKRVEISSTVMQLFFDPIISPEFEKRLEGVSMGQWHPLQGLERDDASVNLKGLDGEMVFSHELEEAWNFLKNEDHQNIDRRNFVIAFALSKIFPIQRKALHRFQKLRSERIEFVRRSIHEDAVRYEKADPLMGRQAFVWEWFYQQENFPLRISRFLKNGQFSLQEMDAYLHRAKVLLDHDEDEYQEYINEILAQFEEFLVLNPNVTIHWSTTNEPYRILKGSPPLKMSLEHLGVPANEKELKEWIKRFVDEVHDVLKEYENTVPRQAHEIYYAYLYETKEIEVDYDRKTEAVMRLSSEVSGVEIGEFRIELENEDLPMNRADLNRLLFDRINPKFLEATFLTTIQRYGLEHFSSFYHKTVNETSPHRREIERRYREIKDDPAIQKYGWSWLSAKIDLPEGFSNEEVDRYYQEVFETEYTEARQQLAELYQSSQQTEMSFEDLSREELPRIREEAFREILNSFEGITNASWQGEIQTHQWEGTVNDIHTSVERDASDASQLIREQMQEEQERIQEGNQRILVVVPTRESVEKDHFVRFYLLKNFEGLGSQGLYEKRNELYRNIEQAIKTERYHEALVTLFEEWLPGLIRFPGSGQWGSVAQEARQQNEALKGEDIFKILDIAVLLHHRETMKQWDEGTHWNRKSIPRYQ